MRETGGGEHAKIIWGKSTSKLFEVGRREHVKIIGGERGNTPKLFGEGERGSRQNYLGKERGDHAKII